VPRDPIIGYISRGRGVSIHRADCPNVKGLEPDRKIEATWSEDISKTFVASFNIYAENRSGLIAEISTLLSNNKIGISMINAKLDKDDIYCNIALSIELKDVETLDYILKKISQIKGIINVHRL
jgi:GTP pyrophosphokinase